MEAEDAEKRNAKEEVEEAHPSKDVQEMETMTRKLGARKARDHLNIVVSQMFSSFDRNEKLQMAHNYIHGSTKERQEMDELYGKAFMQYFAFGVQNMRAYSLFLRTLGEEEDSYTPNQLEHLALISDKKNMKLCVNCFIPIEKNGGCHHMHCTFCNYHFCWDCERQMGQCICYT